MTLSLEATTQFILASGALGAAAMGLMEALKWVPQVTGLGFGTVARWIAADGTRHLRSAKSPLGKVLASVYGPDWVQVLRGAFIDSSERLGDVLKTGIRLGLSAATAMAIGPLFGQDGDMLLVAVCQLNRDELPHAVDGVLSQLPRDQDGKTLNRAALGETERNRAVALLVRLAPVGSDRQTLWTDADELLKDEQAPADLLQLREKLCFLLDQPQTRPVDLTPFQKVVARLDLAIDARVQAIITEAQQRHAALMRLCSGLLALAAATIMAFLFAGENMWLQNVALGIASGFLAVPLAPVSKDLVSLLKQAREVVK
jgi:hypothetical protein